MYPLHIQIFSQNISSGTIKAANLVQNCCLLAKVRWEISNQRKNLYLFLLITYHLCISMLEYACMYVGNGSNVELSN